MHAKTGYSDVTRDFENALTATIGDLCLGWWNATGKNAPGQKSPDSLAPLANSALEANATTGSVGNNDLSGRIKLHQVELDRSYETIVRLREDVEIERKKTTQALNERHAIQTDLDKFRTMHREVSGERSSLRPQVKPWYKFW